MSRLMYRLAASMLFSAVLVPICLGQIAAPEGLVTRAGDRSVILHWLPVQEADLLGYNVYRSTAVEGPFEPVSQAARRPNHYTDFDVENGTTYYYFVRAEQQETGVESIPTDSLGATPSDLDDEAFIDLVQQTAFDYFWYEANPENGLMRDRSTSTSAASIAAVGFGLSALTVGIDRGWITREEGRERVRRTLDFFWNSPQGTDADATGYKGFYYHFLNMETGRRSGTTELSTIDTALLLGGVLHVREYFDREESEDAAIRALADSIYLRVDWDWAQDTERWPAISHGWKPETGYLQHDYIGYNEAMILYLLALGSPTHGVRENAWRAFTSGYDWETHYGYSFLQFPPLFGHQYSHVWVDFRGIQDTTMRAKGIDYFENSRRATLAQQQYAIDNPGGWEGYGENAWGFTASDDPPPEPYYLAHGSPPAQSENGTITPTAPGGSFPFTPGESLAALRHLYEVYRDTTWGELWGPYGFKDAINPSQNWVASDYLGIDQGPIVLMIENYRTGAIWETAMRSPYLQRGLEVAGFEPVETASEPMPTVPGGMAVDVYPSPFTETVEFRYTLPLPGHTRLNVYDVLGRKVATLADGMQAAGPQMVKFEAAGLAGGVYFYTLESGGYRTSGKVLKAQ